MTEPRDPATGRREPNGTGRLSVDELARLVGMSPRNIRAHQARKLLPPPVRDGRVAYYHAGHVRRLEAIKALQRQGFNLVAVRAMLGAQESEPVGDRLVAALQRLAADHPYLVHALSRHGVVARSDGAVLRMVRPRVLRSAFDMRHAGVAPVPALEVLVDVLDRVQGLADELVRSAGARMAALSPSVRAGGHSWEEYDRRTAALAQGLAALLTESFRLAVERSGQRVVPELLAERADVDLRVLDGAGVDNG